jgi:hypothetical protein
VQEGDRKEIISMRKPKLKKGIYSHFKHPELFYEVQSLARDTETEEWMVVYIPLYKLKFADLCVRPYKMFFEKVKNPETGKMIPRFSLKKKVKIKSR